MGTYRDFASVYDRLTANVDYDSIAARVVSLLRQNGITSGLILDLACGSGSLMKKLFALGEYDLIGADSSPEMLSIAREKLCECGHNPLLLCQSMAELDLYGTVSAAVCTLDSVNHLDSRESVRCVFKRLSLFVEPGGLFIFDVNTVYKHKEILADNTFIYDLDDVYCVWQNTTDKQSAVTDISLDVFVRESNGLWSRFTEEFSERAFSDEFLSDSLNEFGFDVLGRYAEYTGDGPNDETQRILYLTKRR